MNHRRLSFSQASPPRAVRRHRAGFSLLLVVTSLLLTLAPVLAPGKIEVQAQAAPVQELHVIAPAARAAPRLLLEDAPVDVAHSAVSALPVEWPAMIGEGDAQDGPSGDFDQAGSVSHPRASTQAEAAWQELSVMFIENTGQFAEDARFQMRGGDRTSWLAEDGLWVTVMEPVSPTLDLPFYERDMGLVLDRLDVERQLERENEPRRGVNLKLSFPGANPHPRLEPFTRLDTRVSYFTGNDPARWRTDVPVWGGVRYVDLYPGVDLEVTGEEGRWTWRLVSRDSQFAIRSLDVRLRVDGADELEVLPSPVSGEGPGVRVTTAVGDFTLPLLQTVAADGTPVEPPPTRPEVNGLEVTSPFAPPPLPTKRGMRAEILSELQDDPSDLLYSTFLGGGDGDYGYGIAVDGAGSAYVTGNTRSSDFPTTPGAFDTSLNGSSDAFVAKLDADGTGLAYATFLGGSSSDYGRAIAIDGAGSVYVAGNTRSSNFPTTPGAFDRTCGTDGQCNYDGTSSTYRYYDAFVVKLDSSGQSLDYATFLGGGKYDRGNAIAVDGAGNACVTGETESYNFPTTAGAYDRTCGSDGYCNPNVNGYPYPDAFVVELNGSGTSLNYATFLGGSGSDYGRGIAVGGAGNAYVTGVTHRLGPEPFPTTPGAYDTVSGGLGVIPNSDGFVTKLTADGSGLAYSTYLDSGYNGGHDAGYAIAVDGAGNAYVTGNTTGDEFPTTGGAFDTSYNGGDNLYGGDAFVVEMNAGGTDLVYGTYLGGNSDEYGFGIALDGSGNVHVTGRTTSSDFPTTPGAFDTTCGTDGACNPDSFGYLTSDAFVVRLNSAGSELAYSTYLGGSDYERGAGIALDGAGDIYVAGDTRSPDFPVTPGALDTSLGGEEDAFVAKLAAIETASPIDVAVSTHALTLNDEKWYTENPLEVTVTLANDTDEMVDAAFDLSLASPGQTARFYVYDADFWNSARLVCPAGDIEGNEHSFHSYSVSCAVTLLAGETYSAHWWVWVQPSITATLEVSATWGVYTDTESVTIPTAQIHPVVFIHGILGSVPPGQKLWTEHPSPGQIIWPGEPVFDPFLLSYYPMLDHLEAMGYEWGSTLFGLTYDWRDSNDVSADFLRDQLAATVIPQSTSLPYVASDGKTDLVVHSMGGLVSRAYIQGSAYNSDVHKVIFMASPHRGFASDYRTREGLTWSDYLVSEVPPISGWRLIGMLMDGVLWPYLIEDQYDPTLDEIEEDCIWIPMTPRLPGYWNCQPAHYAWAHDDDDSRGVPSLYEMLPTQDMGVYLFGEEGQHWPCTAGVVPERNEWLEDLNANISALETALGLDNIYVLYSEAFPLLTDESYEVECEPRPFGHWPHGGPTQDKEHTSGDDLIPVNSTTLLQSGLLPALPAENEKAVEGTPERDYGHKGIVYALDAQKKVTEFLAGGTLPGTAEYVPPFALTNLMRIVAIIVGSPVEIMVTDPAGQRVGYDPATEEMVAEIPDAFYTGQGDVQFMLLFNTLPGEYQITATGTDAGEYELETYVVEEGGIRWLDIFTGTVTAGQVATHTAAYTTTGTTLFFDDMESGGGNWSAEGGWSLVTDTAHSPVTAWAGEPVTPSVPLTLTLLAGLDLSTARMAGLTFWHTYTLSSGGRAQVELSTDGGAIWQTVAMQRGGTHDWTPATLSLTRFAGPEQEPLRLRFRLLPGGPDDRWRVDDVLVEALEPPSLFELPFEDDVEGWRKWEGTGDWAVVTGTLHGGEHSWGASQDGSALALAGRLDLQEATTPRLSFWHLLEGDGATGVVEVSPDGTAWLTLTTAGATEGAWQRVEADLDGYAGQMIHLRFRLDAPGGGNWHLDDLAAWEAIPPVVHSLPFDDDMEEPEANWRAVNGWQPVTTTAHSGASAWWGSEDDSALILVDQLDLTDAVSPTLTFWQRFDLPEGSVGQVRVTTDDEPTWRPVLTLTETVSDWTQVELDLSSHAGQRVGLAFVLEEAAGEGAGSAWLEPAASGEEVGRAQPGPAVPGAAAALPLLAVALVGVAGMADRQRYWRLGKRLLVMLAVLAVGWLGCNLCGLWRYVPPLRTWKINHLDVVEGCEVDLVVSASQKPGTAYLSPGGRWLLSGRKGGWRLMDLVEGSEQRVGSDYGHIRWLEDNLFVEGDTFGGYSLISVPELERTRVPTYPKEERDGVREVELLRQADQVYAVEGLGISGYVFIALDEEFQYAIIPQLTLADVESLLEELPQAVVVPNWPNAVMVTIEGEFGDPHARYYSPDATLYAEGEPIVGANRTPYLEVRTTEGDELIAQVRKRGYAPVPLGWSADGQGFYFRMHTGAVAGVLTPESPVYLLRLPDTAPASAPSGESRAPGTAHLLPASYRPAPLAQAGTDPGWYVDDVVVQEATPPPEAPICGDLDQAVNYVDGGYAPPCSGISPAPKTLKLVDSDCAPLANARVNLRKADGGYITYRMTDADGVADFGDYGGSAVPSLFEVDYHGGKYGTAVGSYDTGAVVQTREYHLQLIGSDCTPIENARVNLRKSNDGYVTYVRTDGEGVASFQVVPEAQMKLELDYHGAKWLSEANTANLDVVLGAEAFRLLLLDSSGDPIENARVNLRKANDGYVTYTRTNADGLASFDVVPGGELKLEVDYHGAKYATLASTTHAQETVQTLAFSLRLTDSTGQPIEDARVNLRKSDGGYVTYTRTGADGIASFEVVPGAQMKLEVDYHGATYATPVTEVTEDTQLEVQALAFSLRLVDSADQPIEDARVNLRKADGGYVTYTRTGADGVASFEVVPNAQMKLELDYHGATCATPVTEVTEDTQLGVQTLAFSLRLVDSAGQPIEDARVNLRQANDGYVTYTRTGGDGVAIFEVVPNAQMKLEVDYHGATCATPATEVTEDTQLEVQTVPLTVHLTVQGGDLADQRVDLLKSDEAYVTYTRTGSDGRAPFEVLPGAEHKLRSTYDDDTWVSDGVIGPAEVEHDFD